MKLLLQSNFGVASADWMVLGYIQIEVSLATALAVVSEGLAVEEAETTVVAETDIFALDIVAPASSDAVPSPDVSSSHSAPSSLNLAFWVEAALDMELVSMSLESYL